MYYYLKSCKRWYELQITCSLFDEFCCERSWGSLFNHRGNRLIKYFKTIEEAQKELLKLVKTKQKKGYNIVVAD